MTKTRRRRKLERRLLRKRSDEESVRGRGRGGADYGGRDDRDEVIVRARCSVVSGERGERTKKV